MVRSEGIEPIVTAVKGRCLSRLTTTPCKTYILRQSKCGGVERLDAEAESDAKTAVGVVIAGAAAAVDTTEIIAAARTRRTLPPGGSGATFVLHLRVACLVICVLRSFSRNGVGGGNKPKLEEGCPFADSPRGLFIEVGRRKNSELPLHRRHIPSALLSRKFVSVRSNHPFRESFLP